jgi:hypothetical protein
MSIALRGNYFLKLKFGETLVPLNPSTIDEFTIVQEMTKFLPSFRLKLSDPSGVFSHILPFDRAMSNVSIEIGVDETEEPKNSFDFTVFRRFPVSQFTTSTTYDIEGLLNTSNILLATDHCRSWYDKTVKQVLEDIAIELGCDTRDVSPSLNYKKLIVQPRWSTAQLLNDLASRLIGSNGESCFKCFIRKKNRQTEFIFRSLDELCKYQKPSAKFVINDEPFLDFTPVFDYDIFENYRIFGIFGSKKQRYQYFDYYGNFYATAQEQASDMFSLADYFLIDGNDSEDSDTLVEFGRNNEFTRDYKGNVRATYYNRLIGLTKMWMTTWGLYDVVPGQLVQVLFPQGISSGNLYSYQYSGFWLVEKVVHMFGDTHRMKLLLTRNGLDTDNSTTLVKATTKKTA